MTFERWVVRLGPWYILWMMIATRLCGLVGGALVVYYVRIALELPEALRHHWNFVAAAVVMLALTVTVVQAMCETRHVRAVLRLLRLGRPFPEEFGRQAGREAVVFAMQHHLREAWVVPLCCLPPVYIYFTLVAYAPMIVLIHITIAAFMGVATAVLVAYFAIDRLMHPVVRHLENYGVVIDYESLPIGHLQNRLMFSFTLTVLITAVMIATLATQKASNLVNNQGNLDQVVTSLRIETIAISACAVAMAFVLSAFLARSVSVPVREMVRAMKRVESGSLNEHITATSTNEIGMLGRSFNRMVRRLQENQNTIKEFNVSLERKVRARTRELKLAQDQLVHSEKMTSLGELVAGIAHEINNSINAVYNGIIPLRERIEEMQREICPTSDALEAGRQADGGGDMDSESIQESFSFVRDLAEVVESGAKRAAGIVTDLKKFGHPGEGEKLAFDVHEGLKVALNLLSNKFKNRVQVVRDFCADGVIVCSGAQLTQVFLNVLDNAQQAVSGNGSIHVATRRDGDRMIIRIRDTGEGIPADIKNRIFDPFFTTKKVGVGTGLGLSISYGIIKGHGGAVEVHSPPDGCDSGTEFVITLPVDSSKGLDRHESPDLPERAAETAENDREISARAGATGQRAQGNSPGDHTRS